MNSDGSFLKLFHNCPYLVLDSSYKATYSCKTRLVECLRYVQFILIA